MENKWGSHVESFPDVLFLVGGLHGVGRGKLSERRPQAKLRSYKFPRLSLDFVEVLMHETRERFDWLGRSEEGRFNKVRRRIAHPFSFVFVRESSSLL